MEDYKTLQEKFWAGEFGNAYVDRNGQTGGAESLVASNITLFSKVFAHTRNISTVLELGANIGLNLIAIKSLLPDVQITAVEINKKAYNALKQLDFVKAINASLLEIELTEKYDMVFMKGVLIHQPPDSLQNIYEKMYYASTRYILVCEYYNPTPVEVSYRGNDKVLFKRDFAGEILDKFSDLELIDYGFIYHRDCNFPGDDLTWFLMRKQ